MTFLFESYDMFQKLDENNHKKLVPSYIIDNLKYELRSYQLECLGRYLSYSQSVKSVKKDKEHILFNMATGSGKTLVMAAIILEKYKQGERNFIFFVNNENILTKTRSNFLKNSDGKYLFSEKIVIDQKLVNVREVTDFSDSQSDSINIVFTTIQKLHTDLNIPRENRLSYEQFKDISVVLLADESHHLNAGLSRTETEENSTWTDTITNIQTYAKRSSLFEFTATIDLSNKDITNKYDQHLIFKYDLKEFRLDKYSKDVLFHLVDSDIQTRMKQAIIISQFRKKVALKHGINLKPLVMFKSRKISDNKANHDLFLEVLKNLTVDDIEKQKHYGIDGILQKAFDFFKTEDISFSHLIQELQEDFRSERLLLIDGNNKSSSKLLEINTLENPENEIRAIFAVDMLNEGWDVLNLFDIVRLYDVRDGKVTKKGYLPGKTTNSEKQLIGRGARYYPFVVEGNEKEKYTRKFDNNELHDLRVIEQLHYHSANNPQYISELKQVLRDSGIYDDINIIERQLNLKDSFKNTKTYQKGIVWVNKRIPLRTWVMDNKQVSLSEKIIPSEFEIELTSFESRDISAFGDNVGDFNKSIEKKVVKLGNVIESNVIRHSLNKNPKYSFDKLKNVFFGLTTMSGFISELKEVELVIKGRAEIIRELSQENKIHIIDSLLESMEKNLNIIEERFVGTDKFEPKLIRDIFDQNISRKYTLERGENAEFGRSQKNRLETEIFEDIDSFNWYAYDDNFGTSEEKYLVRTINHMMSKLEKQWSDIYLLRNEKAVKIYSFEDGRAFEPDFVLIAKDKKRGNLSWQVFIEPKGSQFADSYGEFRNGKEGWKEKFLCDIADHSRIETLAENSQYRVVGLPFYNEKLTKNIFKNQLEDLSSDNVN